MSPPFGRACHKTDAKPLHLGGRTASVSEPDSQRFCARRGGKPAAQSHHFAESLGGSECAQKGLQILFAHHFGGFFGWYPLAFAFGGFREVLFQLFHLDWKDLG